MNSAQLQCLCWMLLFRINKRVGFLRLKCQEADRRKMAVSSRSYHSLQVTLHNQIWQPLSHTCVWLKTGAGAQLHGTQYTAPPLTTQTPSLAGTTRELLPSSWRTGLPGTGRQGTPPWARVSWGPLARAMWETPRPMSWAPSARTQACAGTCICNPFHKHLLNDNNF